MNADWQTGCLPFANLTSNPLMENEKMSKVVIPLGLEPRTC